MLKSINPYNGETIATYQTHHEKEINDAIARANDSFKKWSVLPVAERLKPIKKMGILLKERKQEYGAIITKEMGKLINESIIEIEKCTTLCDYYEKNAEAFLADEVIESRFKKSFIKHQPLGVILGVMPWNFPFWQAIRFFIPALVAGNTCLLKHASNVSGAALALEQLLKDSGLNDYQFQTLLIPSSLVKTVIENPLVRGVSLTGSEGAGSEVAMTAGKHLKKQVLELGGSDPFIICEDALLDKAFAEATKSRLINSGQSCICAKRFIVHQSLADNFIKTMKENFDKVKPGDPMDPTTTLAPLAKEESAIDVMKMIEDAKQKGAVIHNEVRREGAVIYPLVISGVNPTMRVFHEEVFAPVAVVYTFNTDDEAIAIANNSRYGLSSSVWSQNMERAYNIAGKLENGSVYINNFSKSDATMPFGGVKFSGYGREMSKYGLLEFVNIKSIVVD
jgi:succinate-semialdehyde dehydrogenase/glutarate-semialdehyde dehydrogenase